MSSKLGISLGKINYCLKELRKKGLIKISNFKKNKNKINYVYLLTPKGIAAKTKLTINFMKIKLKEYEDLKKGYLIIYVDNYVRYKKNELNILIKNLKDKLANKIIFYQPLVKVSLLKNNKLTNKSKPLLNDYIFC